jgi:DNA-binding transcriptional MerR regulator
VSVHLAEPPFRLQVHGLYPRRVAMRYSGGTYRQLRYWEAVGLVVPDRPSAGRGLPALYSAAQLEELRALVHERGAGLPLQSIRAQRSGISGRTVKPPKPEPRSPMHHPTQLAMLAIVADPARWAERARCRNHPRMDEIFFPGSSEPTAAEEAKALCARCPVQLPCREDGDRMEGDTSALYGIRAGETPHERLRRRAKARHPSTLQVLDQDRADYAEGAWLGDTPSPDIAAGGRGEEQ